MQDQGNGGQIRASEQALNTPAKGGSNVGNSVEISIESVVVGYTVYRQNCGVGSSVARAVDCRVGSRGNSWGTRVRHREYHRRYGCANTDRLASILVAAASISKTKFRLTAIYHEATCLELVWRAHVAGGSNPRIFTLSSATVVTPSLEQMGARGRSEQALVLLLLSLRSRIQGLHFTNAWTSEP